MTKTKYTLLTLITILLLCSVFSLFIESTPVFFLNKLPSSYKIVEFINLVLSQTLSAMAIVLGIHFITVQLSGRKPYDQIMEILYSIPDIIVFIFFLIFHVLLLIVFFINSRNDNEIIYFGITSILTAIGSYLSILYYAVNIFQNFQPKYYLDKCIQSFTVRETTKYNLVIVEDNFTIRFNRGGNSLHYKDPLITFHQILSEIIEERNRRACNQFINLITKKVIHNLNERYIEIIGLDKRKVLPSKILNHNPNSLQFAHVVHFLHYIVRKAEQLPQEYLSIEIRKTIVISFGNMIYSLIKDRKNKYNIEYIIYANYIVNLQFASIEYSSGKEPLLEILNYSYLLKSYDLELYQLLLKTLSIIEYECSFCSFDTTEIYDDNVIRDYLLVKDRFNFKNTNFHRNPWNLNAVGGKLHY